MRLLHRAAFRRKPLCSDQGGFHFLDDHTVDSPAVSGRVSKRAMRANLDQSSTHCKGWSFGVLDTSPGARFVSRRCRAGIFLLRFSSCLPFGALVSLFIICTTQAAIMFVEMGLSEGKSFSRQLIMLCRSSNCTSQKRTDEKNRFKWQGPFVLENINWRPFHVLWRKQISKSSSEGKL